VNRRGISLEWKLPFAICGALLLVLAAFLAAAYADVRRSVTGAADERLRGLSRQLAGMMQSEAPAAVAALRRVGSQAEIRSYLVAPDPERRAGAISALAPTSRPERVAAIELWDVDGRRVLVLGPDTSNIPGEGLLDSGVGRDSGAVGPFMAAGDSVVLPTLVPVLAAGDRVGYLVEWRYVTATPEERDGMLQLIGAESALLLGSPSTGIWTDRTALVPPPSINLEQLDQVVTYERSNLGRRRAVAAVVLGVPWVVLLEFSERSVLEPATRFLTRSSVIALALFALGLLVIWLISRKVTAPLRQLTAASQAITAGDYSGRVRLHRQDELGQLGTAFNVMAQRVEETHKRLEDKIEELRSTQEQFAHAQRMEAVGRLAGGVAHDFNNLLTVILGETELALQGGGGQENRETLGEIQRAGERAAVLTRQLLAFSRRQLIEPTVFSVNELVVDLEKMLTRLIGEDITLSTRPVAGVPTVRADRGQVEQVVVNLVVNARDAMPRGGRITIETSTVQLDAAYAQTRPDVVPGEYVMISVSDTGHGMSAEVRAHLFEPFFTTKDHSKGTGLGLATSYGIVKQSGGHIAAYSEENVGTTMRVYLPCVNSLPDARAEQNRVLPKGTETILLVEDEVAVRQTAARILTAQGYHILEAANADDALEQLNGPRREIHLMLTDVVLPGMGGRELAERVCVLRPEIKVLFASGYTDDVILQHRLVERDVKLVQKPFTATTLSTKVREALDA
jgi:signal transduction histidine kinase/CheY-like chemotaxis protein